MQISLSAPAGIAGTWLIDPANVTINNSSPDTGISYSSPNYTPTAGTSTIYASDSNGFLNGGANVVITTSYSGTGSVSNKVVLQ